MRNKERNTFERRVTDRRQLGFEFNSHEWIKYVKKNYVAWPKMDRRISARRNVERRDSAQDSAQERQAAKNQNTDYSSDLLTKEERLYFNELFMLSNKQ